MTDDDDFYRWYGPWAPLDPPGVAHLMAGFDRPWWLIGGWAIEAFTGVPREHEDVDLSILACDVPALRRHVGHRWHLWNIDNGVLRPLDDRHPEAPDARSQIWVREHAMAPWVVDLPITPDRDGLWTNKRWPDHVAPVEDVTWVAADGIRYLAPEITLLYKARQHRPKDDRDLAHTWPLLAPDRRRWLLDALRVVEPGHAWLAELAEPG